MYQSDITLHTTYKRSTKSKIDTLKEGIWRVALNFEHDLMKESFWNRSKMCDCKWYYFSDSLPMLLCLFLSRWVERETNFCAFLFSVSNLSVKYIKCCAFFQVGFQRGDFDRRHKTAEINCLMEKLKWISGEKKKNQWTSEQNTNFNYSEQL